MSIKLERIGWEDEPSTKTPIDSGNLKKMEENTQTAITELEKELTAKVLFENLSGTTDKVTLSETAANFNYLEIFYKRYSTAGEYGMAHKSVKINNPNGKYVVLNMNYPGGDILQVYGELIEINGTSINRYSGNLMFGINITAGQIPQHEKTTNFLIEKVIGYK